MQLVVIAAIAICLIACYFAIMGTRVHRINTRVTEMIQSHVYPREVIAYLNSEGYRGNDAHRFIKDITYGPRAHHNFQDSDLEPQLWFLTYILIYKDVV